MTAAAYADEPDEPRRPSEVPQGAMATVTTERQVADAILRVHADALDDIEGLRIAQQNRYRSLTNVWTYEDSDGVQSYGLGLPEELPQVQRIAGQIDMLKQQETLATRDLQHAMRSHYLHSWITQAHGVGVKQGARLIAAIGDPAERPNHRMLWAYCGLHVLPHPDDPDVGIAPHHRRGVQSNWDSQAQARVHVIAESCIKQIGPKEGGGGTQRRSPYRDVYDDGREKYRFANHKAPCRRCGPSGSPAQTGSPLSDGHQHARALRLVKKAILKDLWTAAVETAHGQPDE